MKFAAQYLLGLTVLIAAFAATVWLMWRWLKNSPDGPLLLVVKWIASAIIITIGVKVTLAERANPTMASAFIVPIGGAVFGLCLAIIWAKNIGGVVGDFFGNLFTGGTEPPEPRPAYSIAEARRQRGLYLEAVEEVRKQLAQFPNDAFGQMLLADLQAANLDDLQGAELTLRRLCAQPGHAPETIAAALHQLADAHLKVGHDHDAARTALEEIIQRFPTTDLAQTAAQRIAHLPTIEELLSPAASRMVTMKPGVENLGLLKDQSSLKAPEEQPTQRAARLVRQLEQHPLDIEAREELAGIYAEHYQRLDLAKDQFEQLVNQPGATPKQITRWLHQLANLQVKANDAAGATATIQEIITRFEGHAAADLARERLAYLKNELHRNDASQTVKLGTYENPFEVRPPPPRPRPDGVPPRPPTRPRVSD